MLIVMSDLHFADSSSNSLDGYVFNHNLPAEVYTSFFKEIADFIRDSEIEKIDLVLAGDIFEITRSALWHTGHLRPYLHNDEIVEGSEAEAKVLEIIEAINQDERVLASLSVFRNLSSFLQKPVQIHFVPGNHDRLTNTSPRIRNRVQELLGLQVDQKYFDNQYIHYNNGTPLVLVRHGHEYDKSNFSADLHTWSEIPTFIDKSYYDKPVLGDIVTTEVAAKLLLLFREHYSDATIVADDDLMLIYQRLIDFDNVRPSNALINFLFSTPGLSKKEVWRFIEPVMLKLLDEIGTSGDIVPNLLNLGQLTGVSAVTLKSLLRTRLWKYGMPFWVIKTLLNPISRRSKINDNLDLILREESFKNDESTIKCLVCGHSHHPLVELLEVENGSEKYFINSGTFRNVITSTPSLSRFGRLRSKARVLIFTEKERNPEYSRETGWSFDFTARFGYGSTLK